MKGVPSKVIRPNVRTVNFGCYVRKAERGCSNTKGYNRAGKRLEHPTPVHKTKSVWLYATNLPCARVKNRNSRQPLANEKTLEEVPKKKKARRLDWRRSGPNDAMLHEQAALPMVEGGAQLCRKEESRRSA